MIEAHRDNTKVSCVKYNGVINGRFRFKDGFLHLSASSLLLTTLTFSKHYEAVFLFCFDKVFWHQPNGFRPSVKENSDTVSVQL